MLFIGSKGFSAVPIGVMLYWHVVSVCYDCVIVIRNMFDI